MKVGFVGLGHMGSAIARNLIRAGHAVTVYNRSAQKAEALKADGASVAGTPAEAAGTSEVVFTMLSDDTAAEAVVFGDDGIASSMPAEAVHISCSTISVAFTRKLNDEHRKRGQSFVSAPVFGRPESAENKKLLVVAAGDAKVVERLMPLFEAIGRRTFVAGSEPWHANAFKLCGNFMISSLIETYSEAFTALRKAGIDHQRFLEVMTELFGSPVYQTYGRILADQKFQPAGFALKLGLKDVRQVLEFAQESPTPMPIASLLRDQFLSAMANGQEDLDWSSIERVVQRNAGLKD
jgi:3-hydroxyisobutyrate dehydrogenase-like beta-hydroxyacid dehydrogenase